ncbi:hypothetical protein N9N67_04270 [Bacteriovoracaceae bacterium]|nr:hypothetical protein [Bacteriovoracaceae bacterium]
MELSSIIFHAQSIIIVALMLYGVSKAKKRSLHSKIMTTTVIWDVLLILQIELTRSAINTAAKFSVNPMVMKIHLVCAISTAVLLFVSAFSGRKIYKNKQPLSSFHRNVGRLTLFLRILTLITSFLVK